MAGKYSSIRSGREQKPLTYTQLKNYVMTVQGLSNEEYNKLYDRTRNKVRNYERLSGEKIGNVTEYLYRVTRDQANDRQTALTRQNELVQLSTTQSTGKNIESFKRTYARRIDAPVRRAFAELIEADPKSAKIAEEYSGQELLDQLKARAKTIAAYKKARGRIDSESPFEDAAFDYSEV